MSSNYMNDADDEPDYNNLYDNVEEEDGEASEEFEVYNPDQQEDESSVENSDDESEATEAQDQLPMVDPYEAWDQVAEIDRVLNVQAILLNDPALQELLAEQLNDDDNNEDSEDDDDDDDSEDENEEEDEDLEAALSTESESEIDVGIAISEVDSVGSLDDFDSDAFSLGDVKSEPEDEKDNENEEKEEQTENEEEKQKEEKEEEGEVKKKLYRRISKLADSDTTEYETITSGSEKEELQEENDVAADVDDENTKQEPAEEEEKVKSPSPDPYAWIEYEKELDVIEEYDGDFVNNYMAQNTQPSASSSPDESDDEKDTCDVPIFELPPKSVVKKNQQKSQEKGSTEQKKNSKRLNKNPHLKKSEIDQMQVKKTRALTGLTMNGLKPLKYNYEVNLNVYRFDNYPKYESPKTWLEKELEEKNEEKMGEKEKKGGGMKRRRKPQDKPDCKRNEQKVGYRLKRKQRIEIYKRIHPEYNNVTDSDRPDEDIPSYKAKHRYYASRKKTIEVVLNAVIQKAQAAIDSIEKARIRKEGFHYGKLILAELCDNIVADIHEKQQKDAVQYGIEVLLDKWEEHVYKTRMRLIEDQLDVIAELVVTSTIKNSINSIVDDDIYATLIVRDCLAESLKDLGMRPVRINRKLRNTFYKYQFDEYNFESGDLKKKKTKQYRTKKQLNAYLDTRSKKNSLHEKEKNRATEKKEIQENKKKQKEEDLEESKKALVEKKRILCLEENVENDENLEIEPLNMTPDMSETESIGDRRDTHEVFDPEEISRLAFQTHRRAAIINMWKHAQNQLLADIKKKQEEDGKTKYEEGDEEDEKDLKKIDFNEMYENDNTDEEDEIDSVAVFEKDLPNLDEVIEKALVRVVTPTKIHLVHALTGEKSESAVESEKNARYYLEKRRSYRLKNRESGIFSTSQTFDEEEEIENEGKTLTRLEYENEKEYSEIIDMIPKLDRDYYLHTWLYNGAPKVHLPSPPVSPNARKVRRLHLKRPTTAKSEDTVIDIVPTDSGIFDGLTSKGRLNSAMSNERPETASSFYTGRDSVFSVRDIDEEKEEEENSGEGEKMEDESPEDNSRKTKRPMMYEKNKKNMKKCKIEFSKSAPEEKDEKEEEKDFTPAWTFYRYRMKDVKKSNKKENIKEYVTSIPPKELFENEKMEIIENEPLQLEENMQEAFVDDDFDDEIVKIELNPAEEEEEEEEENSDKQNGENNSKKKDGSRSITPPSTPWQRDRQRPLTPDTADSEEELDNLKDKYINKHKQSREKEKSKHIPERKWKEYLKKKQQPNQEPPPKLPKSGWKQKEPLIPWKNANEEVRKHKKTSNSNRDVLINHNRELFQKLQIKTKREDRENDQKLLLRRGTMYQVGTKSDHRKQMGISSSPEDSRPGTTKSQPSYMRPTKSVQQRQQQTQQRNGGTRFPTINGTEKRQDTKKTTSVN